MVYVTGDVHRAFNRIKDFCERCCTTKEDTMIILGDAGINYFGDANGDRKLKKQLNKLPIKLFCIHGNHERRPVDVMPERDMYLPKSLCPWAEGYEIVDVNRGQIRGRVLIQKEFPDIMFAIDGEIYGIESLDGDLMHALVCGGAYSVDKDYRLQMNYGWFYNEQPSDEIKDLVMESAEDNKDIDMVLSHTCPQRYIPTEMFLSGIDQYKVDKSTEEFLDRLYQKLEENKNAFRWLCGHYHTDKIINNVRFMYDDFAVL